MRDNRIDVLRFLGLSLIILAHVSPPEWLFHVRCFDVPLMVFVSGLSYANKVVDKDGLSTFLYKRIERLLFPVYIFLTFYFLACFSVAALGVDLGVNINHVIGSFLLVDGIGYVWIIRIFLVIALLTPLFIRFNRLMSSDVIYFFVLSLIVVFQDFMIQNHQGFLLDVFLYPALGYGILFLTGLRVKDMSLRLLRNASAVLIGLLLLASVVYYMLNGSYIPFNNYKYPPRTFYLFWGASISILIWFFIGKTNHFIGKMKAYLLIKFIANNTIWIYLWHIPLVQISTRLPDTPFYIKYVIIYLLSTCIVYVQCEVVSYFECRFVDRVIVTKFLNYLKG